MQVTDYGTSLPFSSVPDRAADRLSARARRSLFWQMRQALWTESRSQRVRLCGRRASGEGVDITSSGRVLNVWTCGTANLCIFCHASSRRALEKQAERSLVEHVAEGGSLLFATITMRRQRAVSLERTFDTFWAAWRYVISGSVWSKTSEHLGIVGSIRALEFKITSEGWGPHVHVAFMINRELTDKDRVAFHRLLVDRFGRKLERPWRPTEAGIEVGLVPPGDTRSARRVASYVTKPQLSETSLTPEPTSAVGLTPLDCLRAHVETGDVEMMNRYREYEQLLRGSKRKLIEIRMPKTDIATSALISTTDAPAPNGPPNSMASQADDGAGGSDPTADVVLIRVAAATWSLITRKRMAVAVHLAACRGKRDVTDLLTRAGLDWIEVPDDFLGRSWEPLRVM